MIKHKKHRILGVTCILILVLSIGIVFPVSAKNQKKNQEPTIEELTCTDLAEKYGLYIKKGEATREYILIRDNSLAEACSDNDGPKPDLKLIKINGIEQTDGKILSDKNPKIVFEADLSNTKTDDAGVIKYVEVVLEIMEEKKETPEEGEQQPPQEIHPREIVVKYGENIEEAGNHNLGLENNTNLGPNGVCTRFRNEVNAMDATAQTFYKDSVPYCWRDQVPKGTNYTPQEVEEKINIAKVTWKAFNAAGENNTPTFNENFNSIKNNASKISSHNVSLNNTRDLKFSNKCRYDFIKKPGSVYTNQYGETINSDTDYYLNKDYYYASEVTTSGANWEYKYNYAPGKEATKKLNNGNPTCERTCEEAVKVEYGPPVASKAGLCFEYKVKITSYVKCKTKFMGNPPEFDTNYCSPPPKCVSTEGALRKWPQAGPNQEFDSCIEKCDGGKYTQKCSKKCYNKVYAKKGATKVALNNDDVLVKQLANGSYSLEECLADPNNPYGCYYISGGEIKWSRKNPSENYDQFAIDSLGRWYIEQHEHPTIQQYIDIGGYPLYKMADHRYFADNEGFYRALYGGVTPCNDYCVWQDTCGDKYLNPGTAAKDFKENEKVYENAKKECAAGVTCSTNTTDLTISINYDTADKNGNAKKTTIEFPYDTKVDKITSKGEGKESSGDTFNSKYSTLLARDGCYDKAENKNWYLAEWSFPGTYIHNKTGEITFKVPDDTSGWYYENDKFCMPLDALSVNTKWWQWNVHGDADFSKSCYTEQEILDELGTKNGTSNGYNIHAKAKNFGYFGWDFNVDCFYALRNEICEIDESKQPKQCCKECETPPCTKMSPSNYIVRTVDMNKLFPPKKDNTERKIGFNWTEDAKILDIKNSNYHVNPEELRKDIEAKAPTLYSDSDNIDYRFVLNPQTLRKIRAYNRKYDYATWNGSTNVKNGINVYMSNLFRNAGVEAERNIIEGVELGEPGINNE